MAFENELKAKNRNLHKAYWNGIYQSLPPEMSLPGNNGRNTKLTEKIVNNVKYQFSSETHQKLLLLCKDHSTSLFIILQATFKSFLFFTTGQNDIIFGTTIFGRNITGFDTQIGCFCKTLVIRTLINHTDSLVEILKKVKKSNDDMYTYNAFSLRESLEEKMPSTHSAGSPFWVFNMQYHDSRNITGGLAMSGLQASMLSTLTNSVIHIDMQINFNHSKNSLSFQVNYDVSRYDVNAINTLCKSYMEYVDAIKVDRTF